MTLYHNPENPGCRYTTSIGSASPDADFCSCLIPDTTPKSTVRVLRKGPVSQSITVTTSCTKCSSLLEYRKPDDVKRGGFKTSGYFFNDTAKIKQRDFIDCPVCGEAVFV